MLLDTDVTNAITALQGSGDAAPTPVPDESENKKSELYQTVKDNIVDSMLKDNREESKT